MSRLLFRDEKADKEFNFAYKSYSQSIYKYCLSRLKCDEAAAQDCTQETFIVLYKKLYGGEIIENKRAFLYKTATNFIKKEYNSIQRQNDRLISLEALGDTLSDDSEEAVIERLDFESIEKILNAKLTDDEKLLYTLRFVKGERVKDIAEKLKITEANCSMRLTRLKQKIYDLIKEFI